MAQETQNQTGEAVVTVTDAAAAAAAVAKDPSPAPLKESAPAAEKDASQESATFQEESNLLSDLQEPERKALDELKLLIQSALSNNDLSPPPPPPPPSAAAPPPAEAPPQEPPSNAAADEPPPPPPPATSDEKAATAAADDDGAKTVEAIAETVVPVAAPPAPAECEKAATFPSPATSSEEILIWGVPLLGDEKSDTVLLKFLRARDFKAKEAMSMIKNAIEWRREFGIEGLLEEDLGVSGMEKVVFMSGFDKGSHPVCYNVYGEFQRKELYDEAFGDQEKRQRFLRWRIQYLEKGIRKLLDFSPGGISTMVQVTDLRNSPGPLKRELRQALALLQDNYPEFVAKQIFINVPWWYLAFNRMISPFLTQRTKSKFVFAGPSKSAETLFSYISPEQIPVQFGGLSKENDPDFSTADAVNEITLKPTSKQIIEIPVSEACILVWELRVLGWDVAYGAEFVPSSEDGYTVIVDKARKLAATDEPVIKSNFKIGEPGTVVLTVNNTTSKKKKLLYRYRAKSSKN